MAQDKLLAEWFWTDRWMGSSGFLLPMLARGVYREMLTQAWRRGAKLPNDHGAIKRAIGATELEWSEAWPQVSKYWRVDINNDLVNDTQLEVYAESKASVEANTARAQKGAQARWGYSSSNANEHAQASPEQIPKQCPPSPSPSPSLVSGAGMISELKNKPVREAVAAKKHNGIGNGNGDSRSKHPIFKGNRFVVFDWQLEDIGRLLGPHLDDFNLHEFFNKVDQQAVVSGELIPQRDKGAWLQLRIVDEAKNRGLKLAASQPSKRLTQDADTMNAGVLALLKADGTIK